jgi:hypothetical protein
MDKVIDLIRNEPVAVATFFGAAINLAVVFGVPLTMEQKAALLTVFDALLAIVAVRQNVTPVAKLE